MEALKTKVVHSYINGDRERRNGPEEYYICQHSYTLVVIDQFQSSLNIHISMSFNQIVLVEGSRLYVFNTYRLDWLKLVCYTTNFVNYILVLKCINHIVVLMKQVVFKNQSYNSYLHVWSGHKYIIATYLIGL